MIAHGAFAFEIHILKKGHFNDKIHFKKCTL